MSDSFDIRRWRPGPLLPKRDERDFALTFVVAVLCLLACLTALTAIAADRGARGWSRQLTGSATIVVRPKGAESPDAAGARAAETLAGLKGVTEARALAKVEAEELLEPWIGREALLEDLPVPRLVVVELDQATPATAQSLDSALQAAGLDASVDDHSRWIGDIERSAALIRWAAIGVFVLIAAAAAATIAFATRAGLAARRDVIEVLHLAGAKAPFIARLFQARFARMAAVAGLFGAAGAAMIGAGLRLAGGGAGLAPVLPLVWSDLAWLLPCPAIAALTAALAARGVAIRLTGELAG